MNKAIVLLVMLAILALPANAEECIPTTSNPEVALPMGLWGGTLYVDNDDCVTVNPEEDPDVGVTIEHWIPFPYTHGTVEWSCLLSLWTYEESNGIEGLQRGDEIKDDTCRGMIYSDTLAFF